MPHLVLLADSISDNLLYVPNGPSVIEHVRRGLPSASGGGKVARAVLRWALGEPGLTIYG